MKRQTLRQRMGEIIFEADTPAGKLFDVLLLWAIFLSVLLAMFESIESFQVLYGTGLRALDWFFTVTFTIEYIARVYSARKRLRYVTSFYGLIDLGAILPGYVSLLLPGAQYLAVVRVLRLLRVFRVLKLVQYMGAASTLMRALKASRTKITVFLGTVLSIVVVVGSVMYVLEGPAHGFTSIPISMYWTVVTLTTVGFGDITPLTALGRFLASVLMVLGYSIIAVPTGIVTVEMSQVAQDDALLACPRCLRSGHSGDALYCKYCGADLKRGEAFEPQVEPSGTKSA